ncbi:MAG TPA: transposase [Legionella sp.]|nr:transposase [Legionella sp.]
MYYHRAYAPGATYFITVNLHDRTSTLLVDHVDKLRKSFQRARYLYPFEIIGIVILADHFHIMLSLPEGDFNYSLRIRLIKSLFSMQLAREEYIGHSRKKKGERGIWQRRFWEHLIRDHKDYDNHLNYIHYNPVKHGYVQDATDWPYSSIHRFIKEGILPKNWGCDGVIEVLECGEH